VKKGKYRSEAWNENVAVDEVKRRKEKMKGGKEKSRSKGGKEKGGKRGKRK
jgi:hypothetical protein